MKRPRSTRTEREQPADRTSGTGSSLGLDGWEGRWPVDDSPATDRDDGVPMMLNPHSPPTIAPS